MRHKPVVSVTTRTVELSTRHFPVEVATENESTDEAHHSTTPSSNRNNPRPRKTGRNTFSLDHSLGAIAPVKRIVVHWARSRPTNPFADKGRRTERTLTAQNFPTINSSPRPPRHRDQARTQLSQCALNPLQHTATGSNTRRHNHSLRNDQRRPLHVTKHDDEHRPSQYSGISMIYNNRRTESRSPR